MSSEWCPALAGASTQQGGDTEEIKHLGQRTVTQLELTGPIWGSIFPPSVPSSRFMILFFFSYPAFLLILCFPACPPLLGALSQCPCLHFVSVILLQILQHMQELRLHPSDWIQVVVSK